MKRIQQLVMLASVSALSSIFILNTNVSKVYAAEDKAQVTSEKDSNLSETEVIVTEEESFSQKQAFAAKSNVDKAIENINAGTDTLADYSRLRISYVKSDNLPIIRREIKKFRDSKNSDLTREEIEYSVADTINIIKLSLVDVSQGAAEVDTYKYLGVDDVTEDNLDDINEYMEENGYSSVKNVKLGADEIITTLSNLNNGAESEEDFAALDIHNVNSNNIDLVKKALEEAKNKKGGNLTKSEIKECVNDNINKLQLALAHINLGQASVEEYKFIGTDEVDDIYLDDVNHWFVNKGKNTIKEVLDELHNVIDPLNSVNSGEAEIEDYEFFTSNLDLDINEDNISELNEVINNAKEEKGKNLNGSEIIRTITNSLKLINFYQFIDDETVTSQDYEDIGISDIKDEDVKPLSDILKDRECKNIEAIKERVDKIYQSINRINNGEDSEEDYRNISVSIVNSSNISKVREEIKKKKTEKGGDLNLSEIIEIANSSANYQNSAANIISGNGTVLDYIYIHITTVNEKNVKFVNSQIKITCNITIENIEITIKPIMEITKVYDKVIQGLGTLDDYKKLKIDGVNSENLIYINADMKSGMYPTINDINNRIKDNELNIEIIKKITRGNGNIDDYFNIGVDVIYDEILPYVNADMASGKYLTLDEIINRINEKVTAYEALLNINSNAASIYDYLELGITGITPDIVPYVNIDLFNLNYISIDDAVNRVNSRIDIYKALAKINSGNATLDDYIKLNITSVNPDILKFVNADLQGKGYLTEEEIKNRIEENINIYLFIFKVSKGEASIDDYRSFGINNVIDYNIHYLNVRIKYINVLTLSDVEKMVKEILDNMKMSTVTGVLKDKETGAVIKGAEIKVRVGENVVDGGYFSKNNVCISAVTDADGRYTINLPSDNYTIEVKVEGYVSSNCNVKSDYYKTDILQDIKIERIRYKLKGKIIDAANASGIKGVQIKFRVGANGSDVNYYTQNGQVVTAVTDDSGCYEIELPFGEYIAELSGENYINDIGNITLSGDNRGITFNFSLSKAVLESQYRIVLSWSGNVKDLDTHLDGNTNEGSNVHVEYNHQVASYNGKEIARLDHDDQDYDGPETLTVLKDSGEYVYSVLDFPNRNNSGSTALVNGQPFIVIYQGNAKIRTYKIINGKVITTVYEKNCVQSTTETQIGNVGTLWRVFKISNGNIVDINTLEN